MSVTRRGATYLTVTELAEKLGVHRNTIIYWIEIDELQAKRAGLAPRSQYLIPSEEAERVIAKFTQNGQ